MIHILIRRFVEVQLLRVLRHYLVEKSQLRLVAHDQYSKIFHHLVPQSVEVVRLVEHGLYYVHGPAVEEHPQVQVVIASVVERVEEALHLIPDVSELAVVPQ